MSSEHRHLKQHLDDLSKKTELSVEQKDHYRMYWDYTSPYSNKVRAYFNYKEIPYKLMQTTTEDYREKIPAMVGMSIIPVILTPDDEVMQDSTPMMEWFEKKYPEKSAIPEDSRLAWIMWLIEEFSDEYMPRFAMRTRWGTEASQRTLSSRIARSFTYGHPTEITKMGSQMILDRQSGFNVAIAIEKEEDCQSVDQQLLDFLKILDTHLSEYAYLLGDRPSIADFAIFGSLWAQGFNDPWAAEILEVNAPQVCNWLQEIANIGDSRGCLGRDEFGDWLDLESELPDTLIQLVSFIAKTYLPQALGYRDAMITGDKRFTATIYGIETELFAFEYRAGTFAELQQKFANLEVPQQAWIETALTSSGLFPSLMAGEIKPNPHFAKLTVPFVTDPALNGLAYKGEDPQIIVN